MKQSKYISEPQSDDLLADKRNQKKQQERRKSEREARTFRQRLVEGNKIKIVKFSYYWDLSIRPQTKVNHVTVQLNSYVPKLLLEDCIRKAIEGN